MNYAHFYIDQPRLAQTSLDQPRLAQIWNPRKSGAQEQPGLAQTSLDCIDYTYPGFPENPVRKSSLDQPRLAQISRNPRNSAGAYQYLDQPRLKKLFGDHAPVSFSKTIRKKYFQKLCSDIIFVKYFPKRNSTNIFNNHFQQEYFHKLF